MGQHQRKFLALAVAAAFSSANAQAELPTGGQVVAGSASINNVGAHQQNITQSSDKAIINFQSFGIGSDDSVLINQLSSRSVLLGRVVGDSASSILGRLSANGQLFLVNPNGIYFGAGATLDVGGLVASTLDIRNEDFLSGRYVFSRDTASTARADVINDGVIKARQGGYVVLAGDYAANRGVVEAKLGTVLLGSAQQLTLDINGDSLVTFALNERNMTALAGVANSGQLLADGGRVVMTASTARTLANSAVNNSGVIQARGVDEHDGAVYLLSDGGAITVDGTSRIDVSGDNGGGTVLIGGNFHGAGSEVHADAVAIASGATIKADALVSGNGGNVAVWSDGSTIYQGSISARGGARGGNGGNVEVSGSQLAFAGTVDTSAPKGNTGTLLLDPTTLDITDGAPVAGDLSGSGSTILAAAANGTSSNGIAEQTLEGITSTSNVILEATGQITVKNLTDNQLSMAQGNGNYLRITSTTSGGIKFEDSNDEIVTQGGSIILQAQGSGTLSNIGKLTSNGGDITLQSANGISLNNDINTGGGNASLIATAGGINQAAGGIAANTLEVGGTGTFTFNSATNAVNTLAANVTGSLNFKNAGALSIGTAGSTSGINTHGNNLTLNVGNDLTQTASGNISASGFEIVSSMGIVTLTNPGNDVTTLAAATHGATTFTDANALVIGTTGSTTGINSNGEDIVITAGGTLTQNGGANITSTGGDVVLASGGLDTLNANLAAGNGAVTLNSSGGVSQSGGSIVANSLLLLGNGTQTLTSSSNNVATLAGNVGGTISYRDADGLDIGNAGSTNGVNTNGNTLTLNVGGALTQSQNISTNGLEIVSSTGTVSLGNTGNSIGAIAANVNGDFTLRNSSANLYTQQVGGTTGITTNNHNFTLVNTNTLWLGNGSTNGPINAGSGTVDLASNRMLQYGSSGITADKLVLRSTNYAGLSGTANSVNTLAVASTGAGGGTYGASFDFLNGKSLTVGTVNGISGIQTDNTPGKVQTNGNITLAAGINTDINNTGGTGGQIALFAQSGGSYYNIDTAGYNISSYGLGIQANNISSFSASTTKLLAVDIQSGFNFTTTHELTVGNIFGLLGIKATGDVYLKTGTFSGFDITKPYADYINATTNKATAGLMIDEQINAAGHKVYLNSDSGIFQWASDNSQSPPVVRNNAAITADVLMISGTGNFDMSVGKNAVNHLVADVNGSFSFLTAAPTAVDQQTFNNFGVNTTISGVTTHSTLISGSVAGGDAQYNQHNITIATSDDPNAGSRTALNINNNISADLNGNSTINLTVGASDNHKDALVATNSGAIVQGSTLILGATQAKGAFELKTNVTSLSAAGGQYMLIDNSMQTAQLNVLGIGTNQGGGAPTPVGDFFLTTGGKMLLLGGKSEGNYLQLRTDDLSLFGTMTMKDGARVILQPYHMNNTIGIHNAYDPVFGAGWAQTNYTRSLLQQFSQTAAIYVGSTPALLNQDPTVAAAVKNQVGNLVATNEIHIAGDGDTGLQMGYRSLSAETTSKIVTYQIGDVYNLRLDAPTVVVGGFNVTGSQVNLIADNLTLPNAANYYAMPNTTSILFEPYTANKSMWIGWIEPGYAASEVNYSFSMLDKLDKGSNTTFIFSGTTDKTYTGSYLRLAHAELSPPQTTHYHSFSSQIILSTTGYVDTSLGTFGNFPFTFNPISLQGWNNAPYTYPLANRVESGATSYVSVKDSSGSYSSPATLFGYGNAGGTWSGCANLATCQGTNPSTTTGNGGGIINNGGGGTGGGNTCTGASCSNNTNTNTNNQPPANPSTDPTNGVNNNAANTPNNGNNNNNSGNNNGGGGNTGNNNSGNNDPGDPANSNSNSGMGDGGPSGGGGPGTSGGPGGGGNTSDGSGNGGSGGGNGSNGSGSGGSGPGGGNGSDSGGSGSSGGNGSGSGNNGGSGSSNGSDGSGSGSSGSGGSGNGGANGNGSGAGSGNGGAGGGNDSGDGGSGGSGSGSSGSGGADGGGNGSGSGSGSGGGSGGADSGDGSVNGSGSGGSGSGGAGSSDGGNDSGSGSSGSGGAGNSDGGNGSGAGGGSAGAGDSADGNGAGSGGTGSGGADSGDGNGSGASSKGSGSGGANDSDSGASNGSGKGGSSGADSGNDNGSGSGSGKSKGGDSAGGDGSDNSGSKSGKGDNEGGKTGDNNNGGGDGDGGNASHSGKDGNSGAGDSDSGSGKGGETEGDGASAADNSGDGGSGAGGSSGGGGTGKQRLCINAPNADRGQDLPDQGGALANRPLLEVRGGGVNMESECDRSSSINASPTSKGK